MKYPHFQPFKVGRRVLFGIGMDIRLAGVDDPWLRQELGIVVLIKTGLVAELLL